MPLYAIMIFTLSDNRRLPNDTFYHANTLNPFYRRNPGHCAGGSRRPSAVKTQRNFRNHTLMDSRTFGLQLSAALCCHHYLPLSENQVLLVLKENLHFERKYHRVLSASADCHMGVCSGEMHLNTAYQAALESLKLGKALFPDEYLHSYDKMKLAIALSKTTVPGLEQEFQQLCRHGKNAQLAETAVAYFRLNGDIQKICEHLHIHRNSIPYRLHLSLIHI